MPLAKPSSPTASRRSEQALSLCMRRDRARLIKLGRAGREREFQTLLAASQALRQRRMGGLPALAFDEGLPVVQRKAEIQQAIRDHQVVVVCGETGSGKSTQLPKLCLELGRGIDGFIGHTQPRRVAARAIASRLAEEMGSDVGGHAGYRFRFAELLGDETYVKVVTDGMLLAELASDRRLEQYDTLIIDEAHERSLNIDFLLGIVRELLPERPDLKVIITSATIDPGRFSRYFDGAPVIEVSGRTYPVEVRYQPFDHGHSDAAERALEVALLHAVDELEGEGPGDILVFLPGELHIHGTAELLRKKHYRDTEVLPLYARLSAREQQRIFQPGGRRRIVLATNVAETSITVPGIRYVIDSGLARISRYRPARQVQALPIESVSQASAQQRAGRCGREADGICIRLYSEADYRAREAFTPPEVHRTSLASVVLTMHNLRLGRVEDFPFIDPPPERMVKAGYRLLAELGAIDGQQRLTEVGKRLARIPADPRIGRMLLAAGAQRCVNEVLTIAAALSIQDPRDYPGQGREKAREQARQAHAAYRHEKSDFLAYLKLWEQYREDTGNLTRRQRSRYCREHFLSTSRMREWRNIRDQLKSVARELKLELNGSPADEAAVHKALLSGLLGNIAQRHDGNEYLGTQGKKLYIHPSSALFKSRPKWMMCAELVQTRKLYARTVAAIDPKWAEAPAGHLVKREYHDPFWDARRGQVMAREQVSLFGLTLVRGRKVAYAGIDPRASREVFIRQALLPGALKPAPQFLRHNLAAMEEFAQAEQRLRRRGLAIDDERLFELYDQRLPEQVRDTRSLQHWLREAAPEAVQALHLGPDDVRSQSVDSDYPERFPETLPIHGNALPLRYRFEPGHPYDGVTLSVPLPLARQLGAARLSWLVPGLLVEKMTALIKALPKPARRGLGPARDAAMLCLEQMQPREGEGLGHCLSRTLEAHKGIAIDPALWDEPALPGYLRMNVEVLDGDGEVLDHDRNLAALQRRLEKQPAQAAASQGPAPSWQRDGLAQWDFDTLPETVDYTQAGVRLRAFPALRDDTGSVAIALYDDPQRARRVMEAGLRRLFELQLAQKLKYLSRNMPDIERMCLNFVPVGSCESLRRDIVNAAMNRGLPEDPWPVRSRSRFEQELSRISEQLVPAAAELCRVLAPALERFRKCLSGLDGLPATARADIAQQLDLLIFPGFVSHTPPGQLPHLERYLRGVQTRIDRIHNNPEQDAARMNKLRDYWQRLLLAHPPPPDPVDEELSRFRWMLEEYRISLFAQQLKTAQPVSAKRLDEHWRAYQNNQNKA